MGNPTLDAAGPELLCWGITIEHELHCVLCDDDQTFYLFAPCCCLTMLKPKQDDL